MNIFIINTTIIIITFFGRFGSLEVDGTISSLLLDQIIFPLSHLAWCLKKSSLVLFLLRQLTVKYVLKFLTSVGKIVLFSSIMTSLITASRVLSFICSKYFLTIYFLVTAVWKIFILVIDKTIMHLH